MLELKVLELVEDISLQRGHQKGYGLVPKRL